MKHFLTLALSILLAAGWIYWLAAWWCVREYFLRKARGAAQGESGDHSCGFGYCPRVSILKPVKGLEAHVWENFVSFCRQDYPNFEILFGVAEASDPITGLIRRLQQEFPQVTIRLLIGADNGANPKAALLSRLEAHAGGEVLVVCDSDIRVESNYIRTVVQPLREPQVGLVTCPYRGVMAESLPARLEALYLDVTFLPAVMVATKLNAIVGLGATMAFRRSDLMSVGGYRGMSDHLMDDYQLALAIRRRGLRIHLSEYVTSSVLGKTRLKEQWAREVRWSRGIRTVSGSGYPGILLTFVTASALALFFISGIKPLALVALVASLLLRWAIAWQIAGWLTGDGRRRWLAWLPLRDVLSFLVWCMGSFGSHVTWRGKRYRIGPRGALQVATPPGEALRRLIRRLDAGLRARQQIFEFSDHPHCLLRISRSVCKQAIRLGDGTRLAAGDFVGELHLFNDHLPRISPTSTGVAWANVAQRHLRQSLRLLASSLETNPRLQGVRAFRGASSLAPRGGTPQLRRFFSRLHFQVLDPEPNTVGARTHAFFENFLIAMLIWTFNPRSLKGARFRCDRHPIWMSSKTLLQEYGMERDKPPTAGVGLSEPPGHVAEPATKEYGTERSDTGIRNVRPRRRLSIRRAGIT